jgi:energy-coupling factor transporter ATP-binding protein EcfA2
MKLIAIEVENFRAYRERRRIEFSSLTTLIGKNDIGKSTILEALEIFFNNDIIKIDGSDASVDSGSHKISILCEFSDFPASITLDASAETSLDDEYLLAENGNLQIEKIFDCSKSKPSEQVFLVCIHPSAAGFSDLMGFKERELQAKIRELGLDVALKGNPTMRKAIWESAANLDCKEQRLELAKGKEDGKRVWDKLDSYLPMFALFQSDRASKDSDEEVQNPLKGAIKAAIAEADDHIREIETLVRTKAEEIARLTHAALNEIDQKLAASLIPKYNPLSNSKWAGLFSLGMETNNGISLNKRGSGVRRMILVSFFKAEAERRLKTSTKSNIIYAIEEPETSQHPDNQRVLIKAFRDLASMPGCQVILTTHSPGLAAELPTDSIRFIQLPHGGNTPDINSGVDVFGEVAEVLGLVPDNRVRALVCVEGYTDVEAFKALSKIAHLNNNALPDLSNDPRFAFVVLGGSNLKHWVNNHYLKPLGLPEAHIYDSDVTDYVKYVNDVNTRSDGSWAALTNKHEIECYLHPDAIFDEFGFTCDVVDTPDAQNPSVPRAFAIQWHAESGFDGVPGDSKAKARLVQAFRRMTYDRLIARAAANEVNDWMTRLARMVE